MSFELLLCCAVALYGLLNFLVLPRLTGAWNANRSVSKVAKAGVLATVQFVRDTALVATILYSCFALLTMFLRFGFFGNARLLKWAVMSASELHESLEKVSDFWSHWFFLFPLGLLAYMQWLKQRKDFVGRFERFVDEESDRLNEERTREPQKWNEVPADEKMRDLDEQIAKAQLALQRLEPLGSKDRAERRQLKRSILALSERHIQQDYERRIKLDRLNIQEADRSQQPAWRRVLLSKGLFSDLKGLSQALSRVTLAMLAIALIGVAGQAGLAENLWSCVIHLDDLRVEARKEEAKKSWEKHQKAAENASQNASDRQSVQQLANDFGRALAQNPNWQALRRPPRVEANFDRTVARRAILMEVALPDAQGGTREAFSNGFSHDESDVLKHAISGHTDGTRIGHIVADRHGAEIKDWFGEKWAGLQVAINHHAQMYNEPVSTDDLQGELIDRIVAAAFDGTEPKGVSDVMKQARDGMSDATKEAAREAVETEFEQFMVDLYDGKPYEETITKVRKDDIPISKSRVEEIAVLMRDRQLPDKRDFTDRMAATVGDWKDPNSPGGPGPVSGGSGGGGPGSSGGARKPGSPESGGHGPVGTDFASGSEPTSPRTKSTPPGGTAEADSILNDIATTATDRGTRSLQEEQVGALAQYEDNFPRSIASQSSTPLGQLLSRYRVDGDGAALARVAEMNVQRASSFTMLRGFSKVGGVLIGRQPQGSADVRDITWIKAGRDVKIGLVDSDGKQFWFGPFDLSVVHQSLAYAADGRPVAVTMTIARPVSGLKVFLHPALVDTPLGCRVQQLDRLVDTYAGDTQLPERTQITDEYWQQVAAYNVALAQRIQAVSEKLPDDSQLKQIPSALTTHFGDSAAKGLQQADLFSGNSLFRRKPEFFEPSLIKTMKSCRNGALDSFEGCVGDTYRSSRIVREFKQDYLRMWSFAPTSIQPWSGVREREYHVDKDFSFLSPPHGNSVEERLWPFDFIVQIAFTSAAVNLPEKQQEAYVDRQPVEFDQIQARIEQLVDAGIDRDGFRRQFNELRDFTILQRLFRAALNGNLGERFPTLKLAQLTSDTAGAAPYFHTRRWNSSVLGSFMYRARDAWAAGDSSQPWIERARLRLPFCAKAVSLTIAGDQSFDLASACNFDEFKSSSLAACPRGGGSTPACKWRAVIAISEALPDSKAVESAFGVLSDDRQSAPDSNCPPLAAISLTAAKR
jgi:hypothetical protein